MTVTSRVLKIAPQPHYRLLADPITNAAWPWRSAAVGDDIRRIHTTLHRALSDAVVWGYLLGNPAAVARNPGAAYHGLPRPPVALTRHTVNRA